MDIGKISIFLAVLTVFIIVFWLFVEMNIGRLNNHMDMMTKTQMPYPSHLLLSPWSVVNAPESPCEHCGEHIFVAWILPPPEHKYLFQCNVVYLCAHCRKRKLITDTNMLITNGGIESLFGMKESEIEK